MPSKFGITAIRSKLRPHSDGGHVVTADDFLRRGPQQYTGAQPNHPQSTSTLSVSTQSSSPPPFSAQNVGAHHPWTSSDGVQRIELEAPKGVWAVERDQYLFWDKQQRDAAEKFQNLHIEKLKQESKEKAEEEERADAKKKIQERKRNASKESVRRLRQLIRDRYRLDLYVWNKREVQVADRPLIMQDCLRSDGILQEIYFIVNAWEQDVFEAEDWELAKKIKACLSHKDQHAMWESLPPWQRDENGNTMR